MTELSELVCNTATQIFKAHCNSAMMNSARSGTWQVGLWNALEECGLTRPFAEPDAEIELQDLLALAAVAAQYSAPIPFPETLLAAYALKAAGLHQQSGPMTIGPVIAGDSIQLQRRSSRWMLSGKLRRIPYGRQVKSAVISGKFDGIPYTACVTGPFDATAGTNYAYEPRDELTIESKEIPDNAIALGTGFDESQVRHLGALFRSASMVGALEQTLQITVEHTKSRSQFGKPIGRFQAVQQALAVMTTNVLAAKSAVTFAALAAANGAAGLEIAASKIRVGEAAGIVAAAAHQIHGATGFTMEHPLHWSTTRLWSWRDEFGNEREWAKILGFMASDAGAEGLWNLIVPLKMPSTSHRKQ